MGYTFDVIKGVCRIYIKPSGKYVGEINEEGEPTFAAGVMWLPENAARIKLGLKPSQNVKEKNLQELGF